MTQVFVGFGSNQGDSERLCREAMDALGSEPEIRLLQVSSLYRTSPVGVTDQAWFVNGVALCETSLEPETLLERLQAIETQFGRVRTVRWGPRTLDLDILAFEGIVVDGPKLTIPHPRLHERRFVLDPMVEIAPDWEHPILKLSAKQLLDRLIRALEDQVIERLEGE